MIAFRARISLNPAQRPQVVCSLRRILAQTRVLPGCVCCQLCTDVEDANKLVLIEEWADVQSLRTHLRADSFRVVLSALDYAIDPPEVRIDTVAESRGMDFITLCRGRPTGEDGRPPACP